MTSIDANTDANTLREFIISHPPVGELRSALKSLGYQVKFPKGYKSFRLLSMTECSLLICDHLTAMQRR
jgi:hypothetical protein